MEVEVIKDREGLAAWLQTRPEATRQADDLCIATRAALRVGPLWSGAMDAAWAQAGGLTALPVLRLLLTSGVARRFPSVEIRAAAALAVKARAGFSTVARACTAAGDHAAVTAAHAAADAADAAAETAFRSEVTSAASSASLAAFSAAVSTPEARAAADFVSEHALYSAGNLAGAALWTVIQGDARDLAAGRDPQACALWPEMPPDWFTGPETRARAIWARDHDTWCFWTRWWDGVLSGSQLDWDLQRRVALIPDDLWQAGPAALAEAVRQIEGTPCTAT